MTQYEYTEIWTLNGETKEYSQTIDIYSDKDSYFETTLIDWQGWSRHYADYTLTVEENRLVLSYGEGNVRHQRILSKK